MSAVIITYRLKPGVSPEAFERWVRDVDQPTLRGFDRVKAFDTFRVERRLMGEGTPSAHYVELFHIPELDRFMAEEMAGNTMQAIMEQLGGYTEGAEFLVAEKL
jgi:hypothetical protein